MPRVSILTAAHINTPQKIDWLREAIESVRRQTLTDWEMIVVDDLSPVRFDELKTQFADDKRVRWFRTVENVGPSITRNVAAALSESEAIMALDADDMLATPETLDNMMRVWEGDKSLLIYGYVQRWEEKDGQFQLGRLFQLPQYSFRGSVMNLGGLIPVTALHSRECHDRAGGWKAEMDSGLEDIEKWIAAGKAGFCGERIPEVTLLYRKHEMSRSHELRFVNKRESAMRQRIQEIHADVFEGRYPTGCCGGNPAYTPPPTNNNPAAKVSTLDQYDARDKIWVKYNGARGAAFGVRGAFTNYSYQVLGTDHVFEVHKQDASIFRRSGRGQDFSVGVPPPAEIVEDTPEPTVTEGPPAYQAPEPPLATIERLDEVAAGSRGVDYVPEPPTITQPVPIPEPPTISEVMIEPPERSEAVAIQSQQAAVTLADLKMSAGARQQLKANGWTVEKLTEAEAADLVVYKGIGLVTASKIIEQARAVILAAKVIG
ncbi:MAG: glycosyltransferase family 2 protein [Planctomycetota bacterium]|jgi:glycosyltransferase involved in cell wall biosynthesis